MSQFADKATRVKNDTTYTEMLKMGLHTTLTDGGARYTRVPGGWLYSGVVIDVFVPFTPSHNQI